VYDQYASAIWLNLESGFALCLGSRKYKLIRDICSLKQNGTTRSEHYIVMQGAWEVLDATL